MNWPDYDRGLVRRGDIRFWIDESALEQWDAAKRRTPGGQRRFSVLAISTTLMLGVVFRLPLRQTEGFVRSLMDLMGCELPVPDHTTLSRRRRTVDVVVETSTNKRSTDIVLDSTGLKFFGAGEWARAKHGETRRSWRKLHISVDPASSEIRTHELTGDDTADATMAGPLVAGSGGMIRRVFADGAYDGEPVTKAIREARPPNSPPEIIILPRATSIPPPDNASWRIGTGAPCGGDRVEGKDELAETTGLRIESAWRNSHGSRQEAQRRQAQRSHIPIPTNRNRHADRRTQSLYPCGETKHNQDPLTNRGMGNHTIAAPCTKASSGGKDRLGRISKREDGYIRRLLVHGARTVLRWRRAKPGTGPGWTDRLLARRPTNVVLVAMPIRQPVWPGHCSGTSVSTDRRRHSQLANRDQIARVTTI